MAKYRIVITEENVYAKEIEAESQEEAEAKASEYMSEECFYDDNNFVKGNVVWDVFKSPEVSEC